jgi:hypothetical protein
MTCNIFRIQIINNRIIEFQGAGKEREGETERDQKRGWERKTERKFFNKQ